MENIIENILYYINPIIDFISSTWLYIVDSISKKWWRTPRVIQYFFLFLVIYLILLFILHKIYRFFVVSCSKQKANFYLACDHILYQFQYQNISEAKNLDWIKEVLKIASYDKAYNLLLENLSTNQLNDSENLSIKLKKSYSLYKSSNRRKKYFWFFLMLFTLWIYKLFLED